MKIIISANDKNPDSQINPRFARCPWFLIYDDEAQTWDAIDNSQSVNAARGAGIQAAQTISDLGGNVVISGRIGPKAYRGLAAARVQIFIGAAGTVRQAVEDFKAGKLKKASEADALGM